MKLIFFKYIILSISVILLNYILNEALSIDKLIHISFSEQLTAQQLERFYDIQKKWQYIIYLAIAFFVLIKITIISSILYIGLFFHNKELEYKSIWNIVVQAEFIFLIIPIFKIIWFAFFQTNYDLNDVQNFYPLSVLNITGYKNLETWFIYPFQILNLFELFYIIYLGNQIGKLTHINTDYGLKIVGISYVPALVLWVATVMFFTLNYS